MGDAALVCSCREDMVLATRMFDEVASELDLTLSVPKTKLVVARIGVTDHDLVYRSVVLGVLLYGAKIWALTQELVG